MFCYENGCVNQNLCLCLPRYHVKTTRSFSKLHFSGKPGAKCKAQALKIHVGRVDIQAGGGQLRGSGQIPECRSPESAGRTQPSAVEGGQLRGTSVGATGRGGRPGWVKAPTPRLLRRKGTRMEPQTSCVSRRGAQQRSKPWAVRPGGPLRLLQSIRRRNRAKINMRMAPKVSTQQRKPSTNERATSGQGRKTCKPYV